MRVKKTGRNCRDWEGNDYICIFNCHIFIAMKYFLVAGGLLAAALLASCDSVEPAEGGRGADFGVRGCEVVSIPQSEAGSWSLVSCPEWMTPVECAGGDGEPVSLYVESNGGVSGRAGEVVISYSSGRKRSVAVAQAAESPAFNLQRSYAVGWSFDIRTYMDSRGLRGQVFNPQKLSADYPEAFVVERNSSTNLAYFYGTDANELAQSINAKLDLDIKSTAFKFEIHGTFGMSAINDTKRIFSWIRGLFIERKAYLNNIDLLEAQECGWFTADFAAARAKVIDAEGSEASIADFVDHYGTHIILDADLGGCYDYYFSSVYDKNSTDLDIQAALQFGYATKFKLEAEAKYKDSFTRISNDKIEKFAVKGGDAMTIANQVFSGSARIDTDGWLKSMRDSEKWELLFFRLEPISAVFPEEVEEKVSDYLKRLYYKDVALTRAAE